MIIGGEEMLPSGNGIGCNDVEDYCAAESWMSIVGLYIGVIFSALLISEVTVIITSMDRSRQLYHDKVQEANEYMRANKLSPELREHVREYFSMRYTDQKIFHEQSILEDLSPNLRTQIREEVSHSIIHRVPILRENDQNHAFIDAVVTKLQGPLITFPKEIIFYENTTAHEMYFIFSGVVGILSKAGAGPDDDPEGINVAAISNGCYFGEVALLLNTRRTATARSEVITVLHMLSKQAFIECLDDVPEIKNHMIEVAKKRRQRIVQIDPSYDGEIDETFESSKYVDLEDAKTPLFMYDSAVARKREATERRKSRSAHTSAKFALHFNKKDKHEKQQNKALNRLRRASMQAVTNKHKEMRKKSSDTMSLMSSLGSNKISEEENLKKQQIEEEMGEGDDVLNLEGDDALKLDDLRQT
jgi:CRP-like cAMP-binding protein